MDLFPHLYNRERIRLASGPVYPKGLCFCDKGQRSCQSIHLKAGNPFPPFKKLSKMNCLLTTDADCNCSFLLHFLKHGPRGKSKDSYSSHTDTRIHRSTRMGTQESDTLKNLTHTHPAGDTGYLTRWPKAYAQSGPNLSIDRGLPQQASLIVPQEREFTKEANSQEQCGEGRVLALRRIQPTNRQVLPLGTLRQQH